MFFHMVYKSGQIFLPFCHNSRVWQTDRRTDRQTGRILITIPRLHYMQRGKKKLSYRRNSVRRRLLRYSRSFKVTNFDTNRKLAWDFILVDRKMWHCDALQLEAARRRASHSPL